MFFNPQHSEQWTQNPWDQRMTEDKLDRAQTGLDYSISEVPLSFTIEAVPVGRRG